MDEPWKDFQPPAEETAPWEDFKQPEQTGLKSEETWQQIANRFSQGMSNRLLRGITLGGSEHLPNVPEQTQQNIQQFDEDHSVLGATAEIAGGLTGGISGAKTVARYAPGVSSWITSKVPTWVQMAAGGAAGGGIYAANMAEEGKRTKEGATGAAVGAVGGPVLGTTLRLATGLGKAGWNAIQRMLTNTSEKEAERILRAAIDAEDLSPEFIRGELERLGPEAALMDVSEGLARTVRGAAAIDYKSHGIASSFLKNRQAGQVGRLTEAAGGEGFDAENFSRGFSRWLRSKSTAASGAYDEAYSAALEATDGLLGLMNRPSVKSAMQVATKNMAEEGGNMGDVRFFQAVKEELDDRIGEALRNGRKNEARRLIATKNALLEEIDAQVPAYKQARNIFAGEAQLKDAAEMGYEVISKPSKDLWVIEDTLSALGESEQHAFRQGALRGIVDKLDKTREGRNVAQTMIDSNRARQLLRMVFPDDASFRRFVDTAEAESTFSQGKNFALGNSQTSRIDSDKEKLRNATGVAAAVSQGGDAISLAVRLFKELGINDPSPEALQIVTETLISRSSSVADRAARRTVQQPQLTKTLPYGVTGGAAGAAAEQEVEQ